MYLITKDKDGFQIREFNNNPEVITFIQRNSGARIAKFVKKLSDLDEFIDSPADCAYFLISASVINPKMY